MRRVAFAVAGLILTAFNAAQEKISTDLQALVDTERSFAHTATLKGVRDSFLEFFADDAIASASSPSRAMVSRNSGNALLINDSTNASSSTIRMCFTREILDAAASVCQISLE